jgi:hypothetical protein
MLQLAAPCVQVAPASVEVHARSPFALAPTMVQVESVGHAMPIGARTYAGADSLGVRPAVELIITGRGEAGTTVK